MPRKKLLIEDKRQCYFLLLKTKILLMRYVILLKCRLKAISIKTRSALQPD